MTGQQESWDRLYSGRGLRYGGSTDVSPLEEALESGALILDVGCGDGKTSHALARRHEVVACDFSSNALIALRGGKDPASELEMVKCNILKLPFESEKFDAVSCVHVISHVSEAQAVEAALEIERVLRPGGYLLVECFGKGDLRYGKGKRVGKESFERGTGIVTRFFEEGEIPGLFPGMELVSENRMERAVSFVGGSGKRVSLKALLRKR